MPKKVSNRLKAIEVKSKPSGRHADGGGLYLLVKDTGARSWVFRFMLKGKARDIGLSNCPEAAEIMAKENSRELTLAQARVVAEVYRSKVRQGIDPLAERTERAAHALATAQAGKIAKITFREVAEAHIAANSDSWRNPKHRQQWANTLSTYVYPAIGDLPVAEIGTAHVLQILEPIWGTKPETASRVRGRIETVLDAAKAREYRTGENPARWRGHIDQILPPRIRLSRGHFTAMPYDTLPEFMQGLRSRQATAALALEFAILTAGRTGEVLGATWAEIDLEKAEWTIPAIRMKAGVEHRVPLSKRAIEILQSIKALQGPSHRGLNSGSRVETSEKPVFPSDRGGKLSGMAMTMLLRRMKADVTVHGFRSSFRDWAAERTSYAHEVCEMALAHTIGNKAEAAYRRGSLFEKRRRLMDDWADFCNGEGVYDASVTPIRGAVA
ncbi:tyrosine-type recombinase/integrase [Asticcacaulis endophyticus]|uniref:Bacteriophage P4 integrase n=1 Tax=Asticcacaulis endophyticus TaxID=1395890 RepID=A0A918UMP3_9CAUL|nr:site-specific integrase [Asticcacaulis endophyticus]GGZ21616.1 bacteriophage P4 integrase [Asticcacaulis endophyticus]